MGNKMKLTECESMIYNILLKANKDLTLKEVTEQAEICFGKEWKIQTTATFLTRMEEKGYIKIYKIGKYSHYQPKVSLEAFRKQQMQRLKEILLFKNNKDMADFIEKM